MTPCPKAAELSQSLNEILAHIVDLTKAQLDAFQENREGEMMRLDKELENAIGKKERAIGALREHRREHHCAA